MRLSGLLLAGLVVAGCVDDPLTLDRYPAPAARIVTAAAPFEATATGFAVAPPAGFTVEDVHRQLGVVPALPGDGSAPIALAVGELRIEVEAEGMHGTGELHGAAVAYARDGGTSFFTAEPHGFEEWLLLDRPRPGVAARWRIRGATPVQDGARVMLVDATGRPRVEVTAPEAYRDGDIPLAVALSVEGDRIALVLPPEVAGARSALVDPAWRVAGNLDVPRWSFSLSLLADGRAYALGGKAPGTDDISSAYGMASIFDPTRGTWSASVDHCVPLTFPQVCVAQHGTVTLTDGKLLLTGGWYNASEINASAYLFDPVAGTFVGSWMYATAGTGPLAAEATSTRLADGRVLVVGGHRGLATGAATYCTDCTFPAAIDHAAIYDPGAATWTPLAPGGARARHTATLLPDGRVLVAGGVNGSAALATVRTFNPITTTFTTVAPMATARQFHTATLLHDGRVLVAGGMNGSGWSLASSEIYTPATNTWTAGPALATSRMRHTATLLPDGRVAIVGGRTQSLFTGSYLASSELYSAASNTWSAGPAVAVARDRHAALVMPDGRVLVTGGRTTLFGATFAVVTSALLDTAVPSFGGGSPSLATARRLAAATTLANGRAMIAGGQGTAGTALASVELYDHATNSYASTGALVTARRNHTATSLLDSRVLVVGGDTTGTAVGSAELYTIATATFAQITATPRARHTATLLEDGRVIVCGGVGATGAPLATCELFVPGTSTWTPTTAMTTARTGHRAVLLRDNRVLVVGGNAGATTAEVFDPATATWTATGALADHALDFALALLPNGKVLTTGGDAGAGIWYAHAQLFDPATLGWSATGSMQRTRRRHTASVLPSGRILVYGGSESGNPGSTFVEEYDPVTAAFVSPILAQPQAQHVAALTPAVAVLLAGGALADELESYAPTPQTVRYDEGRGAPSTQVPMISSAPTTAGPSSSITIFGTRFTGNNREATGGTYNDSHANLPLLELTRIDNQAQTFARTTAYTAGNATFLLPGVQRGLYLARIVVDGMASEARLVTVQ